MMREERWSARDALGERRRDARPPEHGDAPRRASAGTVGRRRADARARLALLRELRAARELGFVRRGSRRRVRAATRSLPAARPARARPELATLGAVAPGRPPRARRRRPLALRRRTRPATFGARLAGAVGGGAARARGLRHVRAESTFTSPRRRATENRDFLPRARRAPRASGGGLGQRQDRVERDVRIDAPTATRRRRASAVGKGVNRAPARRPPPPRTRASADPLERERRAGRGSPAAASRFYRARSERARFFSPSAADTSGWCARSPGGRRAAAGEGRRSARRGGSPRRARRARAASNAAARRLDEAPGRGRVGAPTLLPSPIGPGHLPGSSARRLDGNSAQASRGGFERNRRHAFAASRALRGDALWRFEVQQQQSRGSDRRALRRVAAEKLVQIEFRAHERADGVALAALAVLRAARRASGAGARVRRVRRERAERLPRRPPPSAPRRRPPRRRPPKAAGAKAPSARCVGECSPPSPAPPEPA